MPDIMNKRIFKGGGSGVASMVVAIPILDPIRLSHTKKLSQRQPLPVSLVRSLRTCARTWLEQRTGSQYYTQYLCMRTMSVMHIVLVAVLKLFLFLIIGERERANLIATTARLFLYICRDRHVHMRALWANVKPACYKFKGREFACMSIATGLRGLTKPTLRTPKLNAICGSVYIQYRWDNHHPVHFGTVNQLSYCFGRRRIL